MWGFQGRGKGQEIRAPGGAGENNTLFKSFVVINTQEGIELRFCWHFSTLAFSKSCVLDVPSLFGI